MYFVNHITGKDFIHNFTGFTQFYTQQITHKILYIIHLKVNVNKKV